MGPLEQQWESAIDGVPFILPVAPTVSEHLSANGELFQYKLLQHSKVSAGWYAVLLMRMLDKAGNKVVLQNPTAIAEEISLYSSMDLQLTLRHAGLTRLGPMMIRRIARVFKPSGAKLVQDLRLVFWKAIDPSSTVKTIEGPARRCSMCLNEGHSHLVCCEKIGYFRIEIHWNDLHQSTIQPSNEQPLEG